MLPEGLFQRSDEPGRGKVISRDRGLQVGGGEEGGPGRRRGLEAKGAPPDDEVIDKCRHLDCLSRVAILRGVEAHPSSDT